MSFDLFELKGLVNNAKKGRLKRNLGENCDLVIDGVNLSAYVPHEHLGGTALRRAGEREHAFVVEERLTRVVRELFQQREELGCHPSEVTTSRVTVW